jgi:uncharacterized membrane protein (UPF0127 family)
MKIVLPVLSLFLVPALLAGPAASASAAANCVAATPALEQMTEETLSIVRTDGETIELTARIADSGWKRAAGFQHICPDAVARTIILFRFEKDTQSPFHMRNCHAPLDIAFIDSDGRVVDIQRMEPYVDSPLFVRQPTYQSRAPFRYAIEMAAGRMSEVGIEIGAKLEIGP